MLCSLIDGLLLQTGCGVAIAMILAASAAAVDQPELEGVYASPRA